MNLLVASITRKSLAYFTEALQQAGLVCINKFKGQVHLTDFILFFLIDSLLDSFYRSERKAMNSGLLLW